MVSSFKHRITYQIGGVFALYIVRGIFINIYCKQILPNESMNNNRTLGIFVHTENVLSRIQNTRFLSIPCLRFFFYILGHFYSPQYKSLLHHWELDLSEFFCSLDIFIIHGVLRNHNISYIR